MEQKILSRLFVTQIALLTILVASGCAQSNTNKEDIDATSWKTYANNQYGFELKYPKEWNLQISEWNPTTHTGTLLNGEYLFELSNCKNAEVVTNCSILSFVGKDDYTYDENGKKLYAKDLDTKNIKNSNWKFLKYQVNDITGITYFIKLPSEENYLRFLYQESYSKKQIYNTDEEILSTFKFVEQK